MTGPARQHVAMLVAMLVAVVLLVGPAAAPAEASVLAQADSGRTTAEWGQHVQDRYAIPIDGYTIQAPQENFLGLPLNVETRFNVMLANWQLTYAKGIVSGTLALLQFSLGFELSDLLLGPVQRLIEVYQDSYIGTLTGGGWGLITLALMFCVFWFGLAALRGQVGRGAGEIVTSFVLAVLLGALLANPGALLGNDGLYGRAKDLGVEVAVTAVLPPGGEPYCPLRAAVDGTGFADGCWHPDMEPIQPPSRRTDSAYLHAVMRQWLVDMYIRQPHQRMAYGQRLDCPLTLAVREVDSASGTHPCDAPYEDGGPHACVDVYNDILRSSPDTVPTASEWRLRANPLAPIQRSETDPDNYMYDMMRNGGIDGDSGCPEGDELAAYLSRPNPDRLGVGLVLSMAVTAMLLFVLLGVVIPVLFGQLLLALLLLALVFILPVALLGGGARRVLWRWFGLVMASLFMIVVAVVGLGLMLVVTELLLLGQYRFFSFSLVLASITSILFLVVQRRLLRGATAGGRALGSSIGAIRFGRSGGGGGGGGGGAPSSPSGWSRTMTKALGTKLGILSAHGTQRGVKAIYGSTVTGRQDQHQRAVWQTHRQKVIEHDWETRNWSYLLHRDEAQHARQQLAANRWRLRQQPPPDQR